MKRQLKLSILFTSLVFGLMNCTAVAEDISLNKEQPVMVNSSCLILNSDKWHAWLDRNTEKNGQYRLNISGEVTLPNPGFSLKWSVGPTDRMNPPGLRLNIIPKASDMMSIQIVSTVPVKYTLETSISEYSSVSLYCEGKLLNQIDDVKLTE